MIKLYRDMILDGSGGDFVSEEINGNIKSRLISDIQEEAYKLGIDHAIEAVKMHQENLPYYTSMIAFEPFVQALIAKLEALKKKP